MAVINKKILGNAPPYRSWLFFTKSEKKKSVFTPNIAHPWCQNHVKNLRDLVCNNNDTPHIHRHQFSPYDAHCKVMQDQAETDNKNYHFIRTLYALTKQAQQLPDDAHTSQTYTPPHVLDETFDALFKKFSQKKDFSKKITAWIHQELGEAFVRDLEKNAKQSGNPLAHMLVRIIATQSHQSHQQPSNLLDKTFRAQLRVFLRAIDPGLTQAQELPHANTWADKLFCGAHRQTKRLKRDANFSHHLKTIADAAKYDIRQKSRLTRRTEPFSGQDYVHAAPLHLLEKMEIQACLNHRAFRRSLRNTIALFNPDLGRTLKDYRRHFIWARMARHILLRSTTLQRAERNQKFLQFALPSYKQVWQDRDQKSVHITKIAAQVLKKELIHAGESEANNSFLRGVNYELAAQCKNSQKTYTAMSWNDVQTAFLKITEHTYHGHILQDAHALALQGFLGALDQARPNFSENLFMAFDDSLQAEQKNNPVWTMVQNSQSPNYGGRHPQSYNLLRFLSKSRVAPYFLNVMNAISMRQQDFYLSYRQMFKGDKHQSASLGARVMQHDADQIHTNTNTSHSSAKTHSDYIAAYYKKDQKNSTKHKNINISNMTHSHGKKNTSKWHPNEDAQFLAIATAQQTMEQYRYMLNAWNKRQPGYQRYGFWMHRFARVMHAQFNMVFTGSTTLLLLRSAITAIASGYFAAQTFGLSAIPMTIYGLFGAKQVFEAHKNVQRIKQMAAQMPDIDIENNKLKNQLRIYARQALGAPTPGKIGSDAQKKRKESIKTKTQSKIQTNANAKPNLQQSIIEFIQHAPDHKDTKLCPSICHQIKHASITQLQSLHRTLLTYRKQCDVKTKGMRLIGMMEAVQDALMARLSKSHAQELDTINVRAGRVARKMTPFIDSAMGAGPGIPPNITAYATSATVLPKRPQVAQNGASLNENRQRMSLKNEYTQAVQDVIQGMRIKRDAYYAMLTQEGKKIWHGLFSEGAN